MLIRSPFFGGSGGALPRAASVPPRPGTKEDAWLRATTTRAKHGSQEQQVSGDVTPTSPVVTALRQTHAETRRASPTRKTRVRDDPGRERAEPRQTGPESMARDDESEGEIASI